MRFFTHLLAGTAFAFVTGFSGVVAAEIPARDRIVVLISVDGFPAWLWRDPQTPLPTLRRLAAEGAVCDAGMKVSNPSVTWINHTTLVTGVEPRRHGVLYNGLLVRKGPTLPPVIEPWRAKTELVRVPTVYDAAHDAGLTVAQIDWVAITNAPSVNWNWFEVPDTTSEWSKELVAQGVLTPQELAEFIKGKNVAWRDMVWTKATAHIIKTRKPNLLLFHPLNTDNINHQYGPGSWASYTAFGYVDRLIAEVLAALDEAGMKDKATVIIATDHGFKKVSKFINPNIALRKAGLLKAAGPTVTSCDAYVVTQGGMAFAFVTDPAKKAALLPELREVCGKIPGVERVLDGNDGHTLGMPTPAENQGMGDLILYAKAGHAFQATAAGEAEVIDSPNYLGTHGYANTDPELNGAFIAWGYGIRRGVKITEMKNLDIAPTIARLLSVKLGVTPDGRVLEEILK
ncbi:MAG: alkaline phosphatase family protein [Verrucomicrobia bacterium]|nr:alkaline phosphatase family protein [Verrucomicrobiota bacterium]